MFTKLDSWAGWPSCSTIRFLFLVWLKFWRSDFSLASQSLSLSERSAFSFGVSSDWDLESQCASRSLWPTPTDRKVIWRRGRTCGSHFRSQECTATLCLGTRGWKASANAWIGRQSPEVWCARQARLSSWSSYPLHHNRVRVLVHSVEQKRQEFLLTWLFGLKIIEVISFKHEPSLLKHLRVLRFLIQSALALIHILKQRRL